MSTRSNPPTHVDYRIVRDRLSDGMRECMGELSRARAHVVDGALEGYASKISEILLRMGSVVTQAICQGLGSQAGTNVYYWPGYTSVLDHGGSSRITIPYPADETSTDLKNPLGKSIEVHAGYGYCVDSTHPGGTFYQRCEAGLWFRRLMDHVIVDPSKFRIGGTHSWIAQDGLRIGNRDKTRWRPLAALAVHLDDGGRQRSHAQEDDILYISLRTQRFGSWGATIEKELSKRCDIQSLGKGVSSCAAWPVFRAVTPEGTPPIPDDSRVPPNEDELTFRTGLYDAWLDSVFAKSPGVPRIPDHIRKYGSRLPYDLDLWTTLPIAAYPSFPATPFNTWYSLHLDSSIDERGNPIQLGSVMLLSSEEIPARLLYMVASFASRFHYLLRLTERELQAHISGMQRQSRIFAHQVADPVLIVLADQSATRLREESRFALWFLNSLIAHIWGTVNMEPALIPVFAPSATGTAFWQNTDPDSALKKVLRLAFYHALRRSARRPSTDQVAIATHYEHAAKWASSKLNLDIFASFEQVSQVLRFDYPPTPAPACVYWKGLFLAFYNVVWQAAYHGLVAAISEDSSKGPYLQITWEPDGCRVMNRGVCIRAEDAQQAAPKLRSKDREFYELLERRLDGQLKVTGPTCVADGPTWETTIRFVPHHD